MRSPTLRVIAGPNVGQVYEIDADEVLLGRDPDSCTIVLSHAAVSRVHARIFRVDGGFVVEDLDSRNGTQVNGERVVRTELQNRDVIKICGYQLVFELREADELDCETRARSHEDTADSKQSHPAQGETVDYPQHHGQDQAGKHWEHDWKKTIPGTPSASKEVLHEILAQMASLGWSDQDIFGVRLAVEEALVNAIKHGHRYDEDKHIEVVCRMGPDLLHIEIEDEGPGFDVAAVPDPTDDEHKEGESGRGLLLMRHFMTSVEFNETGNRVIMDKRRTATT